MPMPMATTRAGASDTMHPSLRARKPLPPLSSPPTELAMALPPSIDPAVDQSTNSPTNATATNSPTTTETKAQVEQVLRNHMRFARAFKLNDPALLMAFLDRDVILTTYDNQVVDGITAVLACLVGPKMGKLSTALHVKGTPLRSDAWQSAFVYEHGLVFKEPLYAETLTWHPQTLAITRITHTRLSNPNDAGPPKSVADVVKVVATLPHRLSLSDEDDQPSVSSATLLRRRSSCSRSSLSMTTTTTSRSSLTHEDDMTANGIVVTRVAALTKLSPIRKRKLVNAYLTVESEAGEVLWKSHVAKKQTLPVWSNVDVEIPPMEEDDFADHKLLKLPDPSTPVVLTLWDYGFFRSLRVASAHITAAQLLQNERTGQVTVDLKPVGLSAETLQLSLSIERLGSAEWRPSMPSAKTAAGEDADTDSATAVVHKTPSTSSSSNLSLAVVVLVLLLAIVAAVVWQRSSRHAVAE